MIAPSAAAVGLTLTLLGVFRSTGLDQPVMRAGYASAAVADQLLRGDLR